MRTHRTPFLAFIAAAGLLFPAPTFSQEKADAGPVTTPAEKAAADDLAKRGALVQTLAANVNWRYVNFRGVEKPDAATFALIGKIPSIVELDLAGQKFEPADLAGIATLKHLKKLNLSRSTANDACMAHLKGLDALESLNLFQTAVTDAGLGQLGGLKNLKRVYVFESKVTDAGAAALAKALPAVKIERGWTLPPATVAQAKPEEKKEPAKPEPPKPPQPKPEPPKPAPAKPSALAVTKPEDAGMDSAKLAAIKPAMEALLKQNRAAGVVTLVARDGKLVHLEAAGMANAEKKQPMKADSIFWIASMTKGVTATAVLILADEGKLTLDEPASKWIPELAKVQIGNGRVPFRPITLRDLLSHTSGMPDPPRKPTDGNVPLSQYALDVLKGSFDFQPGSEFQYGFGLTVAGRIVEIVSGKPFDQFVAERILQPLGMKDTTWSPNAAQRERLARTYKLAGDKLVPAHNAFVTSEPDVLREPEPSGGLFSTAADMARFYQMIANGGELDGKRVITAKGIAEMTKPHTVAGRPIQYGLGWFNNATERRTTPHVSPKSFGHGGAFGTLGWVDPEKKLVLVFMVQNVLVPKGSELRDKFLELAAGAVK